MRKPNIYLPTSPKTALQSYNPGAMYSDFFFLPYTDDTPLRILKLAMDKIENVYMKNEKCNKAYYYALKNSMRDPVDLKALWDDNIWIGYDKRPSNTQRAWTNKVGGNYIAIRSTTFDKGVIWVISAILHELAHVAGFHDEPLSQAIACYCGLPENVCLYAISKKDYNELLKSGTLSK